MEHKPSVGSKLETERKSNGNHRDIPSEAKTPDMADCYLAATNHHISPFYPKVSYPPPQSKTHRTRAWPADIDIVGSIALPFVAYQDRWQFAPIDSHDKTDHGGSVALDLLTDPIPDCSQSEDRRCTSTGSCNPSGCGMEHGTEPPLPNRYYRYCIIIVQQI
uniref:Uncharacterized protein n=1 Tax=Spongospora subterranea TaxID=70186 RepID=A0A0H5QSP5_9EUKA|eukprot:CRZ04601.1 hypothetical protein [Spongospora subterranea]